MILIDTCILSSLAKIDRLNLLDILFKKHFCYITPAVLEELNINKVAGFKFIGKIENLVSFKEAKNKLCILSPETKELEQAYRLKDRYKLSLVDCEYIVLARSKNAIVLTDDSYLAKVAFKEGIEKVYDLKSLLEACIIEGAIKHQSELEEIVENLKEKDYYIFSEKNLKDLLARFPQT